MQVTNSTCQLRISLITLTPYCERIKWPIYVLKPTCYAKRLRNYSRSKPLHLSSGVPWFIVNDFVHKPSSLAAMETTKLQRNHGKHSVTYKPNILEIWLTQLFNKRRNVIYKIKWWHHGLLTGDFETDNATLFSVTKYTVDVYIKDFHFWQRLYFFIIFNQSYITSCSVLLTNAATHM